MARSVRQGFIKPTALISGGLPLTERMWAASPPAAKEEYGQMLEDFIQCAEIAPRSRQDRAESRAFCLLAERHAITRRNRKSRDVTK